MTVNHGVLGSSPCSGAQCVGRTKREVAKDKLQWSLAIGWLEEMPRSPISSRRGRASKDDETL